MNLTLQPLIMSLQSLLSGLEIYIFTTITMPIRLELIRRLRMIYMSNVQQVTTGQMIGRLKRIAAIIPIMQLNFVSIYVHIFPMIKHLLSMIRLSMNKNATGTALIFSICFNFSLCVFWILLKCKTFNSDDSTIESMRYFAQNKSRITHDKSDLDQITMQMFSDQKLYNRAITFGYAIRSLMQIQSLLIALILRKFYYPTDLTHIILFGVHQYSCMYAISNLLVAFYGMPSLEYAEQTDFFNKTIRLKNISFSNVFDDISLILANKQYCLYGNNGIGKTLFAKILTRQIAVDSGEINTPRNSIYLSDTNEINIYSLPKNSKIQKILSKPYLSRGESNLLAIYSVLELKPGLLVLDETLDSIDAYNLDLAFEILAKISCTQILITHREEIIRRCRHFIQINHKKVIID